MTLDEYLDLLDWTGRQVRGDKRGAIPANLLPILERLHVNGDVWLDTVEQFNRCFIRSPVIWCRRRPGNLLAQDCQDGHGIAVGSLGSLHTFGGLP